MKKSCIRFRNRSGFFQIIFLMMVSSQLSLAQVLPEKLVRLGTNDGAELWTFAQEIDHGDPSEGIFSQRFFMRRSFAKSAKSPIILELCGESNCSGAPSKLAGTAANYFNAYLVRIEHRFYGRSLPFPNLSVKSLSYLSTKAALKDVMAILNALRNEFGLSGPVIVIGSSYAGNLAAYLRAEYPDFIQGAVAVSAPLAAKRTFIEQDEFVANSLGVTCSEKTRLILQQSQDLIFSQSEQDFQKMRRDLKLTKIQSRESVLDLVVSLLPNVVNEGHQSEYCTNVMRDSFLTKDFFRLVRDFAVSRNLDSDLFDKTVQTGELAIDATGNRQWLYQTCSEYGFFPVSAGMRGVLPSRIDEEFYTNLCKKVFGKSGPDTLTLNETYYRKVIGSSNILLTVSKRDIWSSMTFLDELKLYPNIQLLNTLGLHCGALNEFSDSWKNPSVVGKQILDSIDRWLGAN